MKGLIIWAQSNCRSTMGLYEEVVKQIGVPVVIALWFYHQNCGESDNRTAIGLDGAEFAHVKTIGVGEDWDKGLSLLDAHRGFDHLFTVYQGSPVWRKLILEASRRGERVSIGCESPCNMDSGWRYLVKELYLRFVLRYKVKKVIRVADKFINYSGEDDKYARIIGWPQHKIVPFGYFPPPLKESSYAPRSSDKPFHILSTGVLSKYRGADILVEALRFLKTRGVEFRATITQEGELLEPLKVKAGQYGLPIGFPGFVKMSELIRLYESCSVYVGAGRHEPWGMRLNDALNCGAPLVVSSGMGGAKMIKDYNCGMVFERNNSADLADKLEMLVKSQDSYSECCSGVAHAIEMCSPKRKAQELIKILRDGGVQ